MDVERLVETWRGPLVGLLAGWGASWSDATELAQDTLSEAYLARGRLRGDPTDPDVAGPWLRGIARNLFRSWARRRRGRREEAFGPGVLESAGEGGARDPDDPHLEEVRRAIARLSETHRTVLYLRYLEDSGLREVAALLGISEKAVEGRLARARAALRDALAPTPSTPAPPTGEETRR